ncbi:MAG: hypothetical protein SVM86_07525 [Candidatus Cloacimonadota bacterium]|nr:hypothetical protein [Candidatus Cloacimonadota bacterium]
MSLMPLVPSSKSILNRVLLISTYLKNTLILQNYYPCKDSETFLDNLKKLGFDISIKNTLLKITPPEKIKLKANLFIEDAGTVYRFLLARLCFEKGGKYIFKISKQLQNRPIKELVQALQELGAKIEKKDESFFIEGKILQKKNVQIVSQRSSQFVSALYLLAPLAGTGFRVKAVGSRVSASYLIVTQKVLQDFGIIFENDRCSSADLKNPHYYYLEPDYSALAYFWLLGSLNDTPIYTGYSSSIQPDSKFWYILKKMGAKVVLEKNTISLQYKQILGIDVDMENTPDQVPSLVIAALFAKKITTISQIDHLRYKESNRIENLIFELQKIGANIKYKQRRLVVYPLAKEPKPTSLESHQDHRLYMSFSILKQVFPQLQVTQSSCVQKSFPNFNKEINKLRTSLNFSKLKRSFVYKLNVNNSTT